MKLRTTVLTCEPFAHVVIQDKREFVCDNCFAESENPEEPFKKCTSCKFVHYCSVRCQKASWKDLHREECAYLTRLGPRVPTDTARIMARTVLRLRKGTENEHLFLLKSPSQFVLLQL
jgi:SET and MYND domain-containing protein